MERVLGAVTKEHSEQEAFRVILNKLNEEGYTAVEFIDLKGTLIGHSPTSKDNVKVVLGNSFVNSQRRSPEKRT
jgi:hypothetical protein